MIPREAGRTARVERLQLQERTAAKLRVLLDDDVQRWFDDIDAAIVQSVVASAQEDGDRCRLLALRLRAMREVRDFICGAATGHDRILQKLQELTDHAA